MLVEALEHASQDIFHDTVIVLLATSCMTKDCLVFNRRIQIKTVKFQFASNMNVNLISIVNGCEI